MDNTELKHHGIKGMRWGVRRYQNEDGSLTAAGKKRYDRDTRDMSDSKKKRYKADPDKWVMKDLENTKSVTDAGASMARELKRVTSKNSTKRIRMDLSAKTDKEMRDEINRALLEKQYNELFAPKAKVSKGKEILSKTLDVAGDVLVLGSTALGIAVAIKKLKEGL